MRGQLPGAADAVPDADRRRRTTRSAPRTSASTTTVPRDLSEFTYLGARRRPSSASTDANSIDLGVSYAYTPRVAGRRRRDRQLDGADLTYRYMPLAQPRTGASIWGTEVLYNRETRPIRSSEPGAGAPTLSATTALQDVGDGARRADAESSAARARSASTATSRRASRGATTPASSSTASQAHRPAARATPSPTRRTSRSGLSEFQRIRAAVHVSRRARRPREPVLPAVDRRPRQPRARLPRSMRSDDR